MTRATALINELGAELDRRLELEARPGERLRLLREATNRIVRAANDAADAYRRAKDAVERDARREVDPASVEERRAALRAARAELLAALADAGRRYPKANIGLGASADA